MPLGDRCCRELRLRHTGTDNDVTNSQDRTIENILETLKHGDQLLELNQEDALAAASVALFRELLEQLHLWRSGKSGYEPTALATIAMAVRLENLRFSIDLMQGDLSNIAVRLDLIDSMLEAKAAGGTGGIS